MVCRKYDSAQTLCQCKAEAIRQRNLSRIDFQVSCGLPERSIHIFAGQHSCSEQIGHCASCIRFVRRPEKIVIHFTKIDSMSIAEMGSIRQYAIHDRTSRLIPQIGDHGAGVEDIDHDRSSEHAVRPVLLQELFHAVFVGQTPHSKSGYEHTCPVRRSVVAVHSSASSLRIDSRPPLQEAHQRVGGAVLARSYGVPGGTGAFRQGKTSAALRLCV